MARVIILTFYENAHSIALIEPKSLRGFFLALLCVP